MENEHNINRDTGVIYKSGLKKYYLLREGLHNEDLANKYLLAMVETILEADRTPLKEEESILIDAFLTEINTISENKAEKYNRKVERDKEKDISKNKLDVIADLYNQGYTQREIAEILEEDYGIKISQPAVSKRLTKIKTEYPELLENLEQNSQSNEKIAEQDNITSPITDITNITNITNPITDITDSITNPITDSITNTTDITNPITNEVINSDDGSSYNHYNGYNHNVNDNENDNININNNNSNIVDFNRVSESPKSRESFNKTKFYNYRGKNPTTGALLVMNAGIEGWSWD